MKLFPQFRISCLLILLSNFCVGQEIRWDYSYNSDDVTYFNCIESTKDGGFILGGSKSPNGMTTYAIANYWILKIDSIGQFQWEKYYSGYSGDGLMKIVQTKDGGYLLGGYSISDSAGSKTENTIGGNGLPDYWIIKTDSLGNIQWQNTIGSTANDYLRSVIQNEDGGYLLAGSSNGGISGDKTDTCRGNTDIWIIKIDSIGNPIWQKTIGGSGLDRITSMNQTSDKGYIVGGNSESPISGEKSEICNGQLDCWILKLDSACNIVWQNTIGGSQYDDLVYTEETDDGGYILGGFSKSDISGDKTEDNINFTYDCWIIKVDSLGNIVKQNTIGGKGEDYLKSIHQTFDGGYILSAMSDSKISGDKTQNSISYLNWDSWVLKLDSSLNIIWQRTFVNGKGSNPTDLIQLQDQDFLMPYAVDNSQINWMEYFVKILKLSENFNSITGNLFLDLNSNSIQDTLEPSVTNRMVQESTSGRITFSQQNGSYHLGVLDTGVFAVTPAVLNYFSAVPVSQSATFTSLHQKDSLNNFAYQPVGVANDLCITLNGFSTLRPGFNSSFIIAYQNNGNTVLNATVFLNLDSNTTLLTSSVAPDTIIGNSVIWYVGNLNPFQNGTISGTVNVSSTAPIGTVIIPTVRIEPIIGDVFTPCNYDSWTVAVSGSFDPNEILVDEDTLFTTQLSNAPYLEYVINFQNTGNDTAFTVKVLNPIDTNLLDLSSWEFINSSHPVSITWKSWEKNFEFDFSNILLADSNVNEAASHGFVRYRIKPKSNLSTADEITNQAYIYFDFNFPITTNTAVTSIVLPTEITEVNFQKNSFAVIPHPLMVVSVLKFNNSLNDKIQFTLLDITGRILENSFTSGSKIILEKGDKQAGVYFFELLNVRTNEKMNGKILIGE